MDAAGDEPIDIAAQLGFIDVAAGVERDEIGGEDAAQFFGHGGGMITEGGGNARLRGRGVDLWSNRYAWRISSLLGFGKSLVGQTFLSVRIRERGHSCPRLD